MGKNVFDQLKRPKAISLFIATHPDRSSSFLVPSKVTSVVVKFLLIFLIVGLAGVSYGHKWQTQQLGQSEILPISNWKTYINLKYGYSVKYPPHLAPNEFKDDIYLNLVDFKNPSREQKGRFRVSVRNAKLEDEVKFIKWTEEHALTKIVSEIKITIDGYPSARLEYEPERPDIGNPTAYVVLFNGKYSYTISSEINAINSILSTFKLTSQN